MTVPLVKEQNYNNYKQLQVLGTYQAFRALLTSLIHHNRQNEDIKSVVLTSFCTGAGKMSKSESAKQMRLAYDLVNNPVKSNWENAHKIDKVLSKKD